MFRTKASLLLFFLASLSVSLSAQEKSKAEIKTIFREAESWFFYEEYRDALPYYLDLLEYFPGNDNYNYKIGMCYLNIPGQKHRSIEYLEKASGNVAADYKDENFRETRAPLETIFRLGDAYRVNNRLDDALAAYRKFRNQVDAKKYNLALVDEQIRACENAKRLIREPLCLDATNMGDVINSRFSEYNAVVSQDENTIVFMRRLQFFDAPMYSTKINGRWSEPRVLTPELGADEDLFVSSLSGNGKELYLYKLDDYDGNIYVSLLDDETRFWTRIIKLNDNINTKYWESHASISADGRQLYFTSNRKGGYGDLDIWVSHRDSIFDWGTARNLGPNINTPYNEETPFISSDGTTLFFSSYGHLSMGGYDVFYSTLLENGQWSKPLNMNYPVNTPDDDVFYFPLVPGVYAYKSLFAEGNLGERDIYRLEIYSDQHPKKFIVKGTLTIRGMKGTRTNPFVIHAVDRKSGDTVSVVHPDRLSGEYAFDIVSGNYNLIFSGPGLTEQTELFAVTNATSQKEFIFNKELVQTDFLAELDVYDTLVFTERPRPVEIAMKVEKGSRLLVETIRDSIVVSTTEFRVTSSDFVYRFEPDKGITLLRFTLTDQAGNTNVAESIVERVTRPVLPVITKPIPEDIIAARNQLAAISDGRLRTAIDSLDLEKENIRTEKELRAALLSKAPEYGYTEEHLNRVFSTRNKLLQTNFSMVYDYLEAESRIRAALIEIDTSGERIRNKFSLIEQLNLLAQEKEYTPDEVREALLNPRPREVAVRDRMQTRLYNVTKGATKEYLETYDPDKEGQDSFDKMVNHLFLLSDSGLIDQFELLLGLAIMAADGNLDVNILLASMVESSQGSLHDFLSSIDPYRLKINSLNDLVRYLLKQGLPTGFKPADFGDLLTMLAEKGKEETEVLVRAMEKERMVRPGKYGFLTYALPAAGLMLLFLFIVYRRRKKKKE